MNLHTASDPSPRKGASDQVVILDDIGVKYTVPQERIPTFKEYAIRWLRRDIQTRSFWALKNLSLSIGREEVLGIIGPNGAGKSTLLKVIARVLHPTQGRVRIRGLVAPLLELGAGFDFELTGRENIHLNGAILGFSRDDIEKRMDRMIDFSGLRDFIDAPIRTYSSGMIARLGFAVATDVRPEILIVDEILGVGDAEFQARSAERIQRFKGEGTTILLVSHSLTAVQEMCTKVLWLEKGEIKAIGKPGQVINQYLARNEIKEEAQLAETVSAEDTSRWGSREIEIIHVNFHDTNGNERHIFRPGEEINIKIEYRQNAPVKNPVFGLALHRQDGLHISGPNTRFSEFHLEPLGTSGVLTYKIPYLTLLSGLYEVSAAVVDHEDQTTFDYHDRRFSFRINNDETLVKEKYGLLTLRGKWFHYPDTP